MGLSYILNIARGRYGYNIQYAALIKPIQNVLIKRQHLDRLEIDTAYSPKTARKKPRMCNKAIKAKYIKTRAAYIDQRPPSIPLPSLS